MPLYDDAICPVCKQAFGENDDVVFCPECGTPHHRECYNLVGHCVNQGLHNSHYNYYEEQKHEHNLTEPVPSVSEEKAQANPEQPSVNMQGGFFGYGMPYDMNSVYDRDSSKIDGESVSDFAAAIRSNVPRFISVFKQQEEKKKKTAWNWGAFFFGSLYFFYRKMFRQGISLLCAFICIVLGGDFAIMKLAPEYLKAFTDFYAQYSQITAANRTEMAQAMLQLNNASDYQTARLISLAVVGLILIIRVIEALYADQTYKKSISAMIKRVTALIEDGASFQAQPMMSEADVSLTQDQMRRIYLARRGGVSVFAPCAVIMLMYLLMMFL